MISCISKQVLPLLSQIGIQTQVFIPQGSILDDLLGGEMNSPDKAGLLKKQGNSRLRDWKSRYCAVKGEITSILVHFRV